MQWTFKVPIISIATAHLTIFPQQRATDLQVKSQRRIAGRTCIESAPAYFLWACRVTERRFCHSRPSLTLKYRPSDREANWSEKAGKEEKAGERWRQQEIGDRKTVAAVPGGQCYDRRTILHMQNCNIFTCAKFWRFWSLLRFLLLQKMVKLLNWNCQNLAMNLAKIVKVFNKVLLF